ncbi:PilZ domain-containing protein [Novosphingobium lentum]|uniref:PilZ domain-containing protein n=1 Tax=Novosphingobium lentum TaxID=145287 RepID=UPI0008328CB7|nr:PilZ domain-containing protein [Novosphingobium lentum]
MTELDHRHLGRDSLFLMADVRLTGTDVEHRIKVRNLSPGGMMAEGPMKVQRGTQLQVNLRNIGWTDGVVAWIQDSRFGIAFFEDVDAKLVRAPVPVGESMTPRFVKPPMHAPKASSIRKI